MSGSSGTAPHEDRPSRPLSRLADRIRRRRLVSSSSRSAASAVSLLDRGGLHVRTSGLGEQQQHSRAGQFPGFLDRGDVLPNLRSKSPSPLNLLDISKAACKTQKDKGQQKQGQPKKQETAICPPDDADQTTDKDKAPAEVLAKRSSSCSRSTCMLRPAVAVRERSKESGVDDSVADPGSAETSNSTSELGPFRKPSGPVAIQAYRALQEREKRRLKNQSSYSLSADEAEPLSRADHKPSASTPLQSKGSVNALLLAHSNSPSSPVVLPPLAGHIRKPSIPPAQEQRPSIAERRKCVLPPFNQHLSIPSSIRSNREISQEEVTDSYPPSSISGSGREMPRRKVWVQRAGSSATLVAVAEDDLVDDLRDAILRKYANSLGRTFDAPDLGIRLVPRKSSAVRASITDRLLGPEEHILSTLDKYYPGGQTVEDALIIDVPQRRTPRPSPRHVYYTSEEVMRPAEGGEEYFPPVSQPPPPAGPPNGLIHHAHTPPVPAMSILTTGQAPNVPSPPSFPHPHRPRVARTHTHTPSPTILPPQSAVNMATDQQAVLPPPPNPMSPANSHAASPPASIAEQISAPTQPPPPQATPSTVGIASPPQRGASPRPHRTSSKHKVSKRSPSSNLLDGTVPPINVLIVEDNIINLKLLEAFMKRLKVRWQTAMNGRDAVVKWRQGGFHLVLMDIQLPVMNGLDATREIRRLERANRIGVFPKSAKKNFAFMQTPPTDGSEPTTPQWKEDDVLDVTKFKSPVIIVALTASSLQSDRHEALAAGCNDFLTKPVNMGWLEQKVTEWGSMQALIDYEGWCRWRGFPQSSSSGTRSSSMTSPVPSSSSRAGAPVDDVPPIAEDAPLLNSGPTENFPAMENTTIQENITGPLLPPGQASQISRPTSPGSPMHHRRKVSRSSAAGSSSSSGIPFMSNNVIGGDSGPLDPDSISPTTKGPMMPSSIDEVVDRRNISYSSLSRSKSTNSGGVRRTHSFRTRGRSSASRTGQS